MITESLWAFIVTQSNPSSHNPFENLFGASRCKAKDATGLEVLVDLRGFSKNQTSDADRRPAVQAAEYFVVSVLSCPTDQQLSFYFSLALCCWKAAWKLTLKTVSNIIDT